MKNERLGQEAEFHESEKAEFLKRHERWKEKADDVAQSFVWFANKYLLPISLVFTALNASKERWGGAMASLSGAALFALFRKIMRRNLLERQKRFTDKGKTPPWYLMD